MAQYQFITQVRNGAQITDVIGLRDRKILIQEGQGGQVSASLRVNDPRARRDSLGGLATGQHELKVYRDGAPIETVFQLARTSLSGTENTTTLGFEWQGIASYLQDAKIIGQPTVFSSTTLPWTWINAFQSRTGGSLGITQGAVTGVAPNRQVSLLEDAALFEQITALSTSGDGFSWAIDTSRAYCEWHATRGSDNGLVLEPGVNVAAWSYEENTGPGEIVSDATGRGAPGVAEVTASSSVTRGLYGRREAVVSVPSSASSAQIQAVVDAAVIARSAPLIIPQIRLVRNHPSVEWGAYWIGDIVTFRVRIGAYDWINAPYRIVQIDIALDDNDNETITLGVNAL